jgi:Holliday junction resolvase RusA-like endonuclease
LIGVQFLYHLNQYRQSNESLGLKIESLKISLRKWHPQNQWPWSERLFAMISFSGPKEYLENCDVDNLAKAALDAFKGIVYIDDKQIHYLIAFKENKPFESILNNTPALIIGLKKIGIDFKPTSIPKFLDVQKESEKDHPAQLFFQVNGKNMHIEVADGISSVDLVNIEQKLLNELKH